MKNVSKLLFVILIGSLSLQTYAQKYGIKGGLNLSNQMWQEDGETLSSDFKMKPGFHIGGTYEHPISGPISIQAGLIFKMKGLSMSEEYGSESYTEKFTLYYLDIPVVVKAVVDVSSAVEIYGEVGPYLGMGLSGKSKWEYVSTGYTESDEEKVDWGSDSDNDHFKRPDFGLSIGGGVIIKGVQVGASYDLGLANISAYTENGAKIKNRVLLITGVYWFGK